MPHADFDQLVARHARVRQQHDQDIEPLDGGGLEMWSDIETRRDYLNYLELAEVVSEILLDRRMRPVSVGVFGTWGTGKSSLLNLIEAKLLEDSTDDIIVIRFDAWLYQGYDDARAALMDVIARTLYEAAKQDAGLLGVAERFMKRVNTMRTLGFAVEVVAAAHGLPMFGAGAKAVSALGNIVKGTPSEDDSKAVAEGGKAIASLLDQKMERSPPQEIDAFREEFRELLTGLNKTMVVFVDNLDRCLPTQTIHTLEALRLFLFMEQSAFVVAADEDMVRHSVSQHFNGASARHVTDYLDKLIQIPVRVPRLGITEIRAYLFMLFAEASGVAQDRLDRLRSALEANLRLSWKQGPISVDKALELVGPASASLKSSFAIADRMAALLANSTSVNGNPRIVKRLLNVVRLRARIAERRQMPVDEEMVAKFALFERCAEPAAVNKLYALINEAPSGKPKLIVQLEKSIDDMGKFTTQCPPEWEKSVLFLHDWLGLKPVLAGVDLRPLVYLSRETAALRTQSGELSQQAADALSRLVNVKTLSSPAAGTAIQSIPDGEEVGVMRELIAIMRAHTDWKVKPDAFNGAKLLAEADPASAEQLGGFLGALPVKTPPWMSVAVGESTWFKRSK